jgi:sugar lactone lactonase YvrE
MLLVLGAFAQPSARRSVMLDGQLQAGDIIYADSGNAIEGGFIVKVDPDTGEQTVLSSGGDLIRPFDVVLDAQGQIIASDSGRCCRLTCIAPATGLQTVVANNSPPMLGLPYGLTVAGNGDVLIANGEAIVRVNPVTGETRIVTSGGASFHPLGVTVSAEGDLFVLNRASPSEILRVHPIHGTRKVVSRGGLLRDPRAIVAKDNFIYVTDVAADNGDFGLGRVIRVDARTGAQSIVSEGGFLVGPVGIALEDDGQIVVGDPYTINPASNDLFDGGVVRIDPVSGAQTLIARGYGGMANPCGLTVVPGQRSAKNGVAVTARTAN